MRVFGAEKPVEPGTFVPLDLEKIEKELVRCVRSLPLSGYPRSFPSSFVGLFVSLQELRPEAVGTLLAQLELHEKRYLDIVTIMHNVSHACFTLSLCNPAS